MDEAKEYIGFLFSQIDSLMQSSDQITIDNGFRVDVILTKISDYKIKPGKSETKFLTPKKSIFCNNVYKECVPLKFKKALVEIKCGFLDLTQVCSKSNCLLVSVAFGLYMRKFNFDIKKCLRNFLTYKTYQCNIFIAENIFPLSVAKISEKHIWIKLHAKC